MESAWLIVPYIVLVLAILFDSAIRRGKLGSAWVFLALAIVGYFVVHAPGVTRDQGKQAAPRGAAYEAGACATAFLVYLIWTRKQTVKRAKQCRSCGAKLGLFNRVLDQRDLCTSCGRATRLEVRCPQCGTRFGRATKEMIGTIGECGKCGAEFDVEEDGVKLRPKGPPDQDEG